MSAKAPGTPLGELVTYFLRLGGADRSCLPCRPVQVEGEQSAPDVATTIVGLIGLPLLQPVK
jgi:hypothetical protein